MADTGLGFDNVNGLFPGQDAFNIGGIPSAFGQSVNVNRAEAAKQFLGEQLQRLPLASQVEQGELQKKLALQPQQLQTEQERLSQEYSTLKGKPVGELVDNLAESWETAKDQDEISRARTYGNVVQTWKAKHPGQQLPPELENYHPQVTDSHWQDAYNMKRHSIEFSQKMEEKEMEKKYGLEQARITGAANIEAQRRRGEVAESMRNHNDKKNEAEISRLKRVMASEDLDTDDKVKYAKNLEALVGPQIEDAIIKKYGNATNIAILPKDKQEQIKADIKKTRNEYLDAHGLRMTVKDSKGNSFKIPVSQWPDAKKQGYKEVK